MINIPNTGFPNMGPSFNFDVKKYVVRYMRADVGDPVQMAELELLETKGLEARDVVILSKEHYSFMRDYFIVVNYLEKKTENIKEEDNSK